MKRSDALAPLSRDHHQALFTAMKLKRAEDLAERDRAIDFFALTEHAHMAVEEQVLLPGWLAKVPDGPGAAEQMARRVHDEHAALRLAAKRLESEEVTVDDLRELGIVLERHVRYEERELFPAIERDLSEEDLNALGEALERAGS
ncbi:MAG: hemerythrin domain-containing protein [Solirubrobacterales bacterium]|nr:hemerythrin domain-containing protein [Thermoleophilales bacterium]MCO5327958.1 hemerythrin domain-containing protein [Solirubrobacterales bacterium]